MGRRRRGDWDASNLWDSLDSKTLDEAPSWWSRNDNIEGDTSPGNYRYL